ncbi:MAG: aspartate/glutamate racemase family protein [Spirochaetes bacterium]|nr:aspartate/glutamate racemase family protein [Spirochaetota bacterium]
MVRVAAIYTADTLVPLVKNLVQELMPSVDLVNIVDDSLIRDVIREGKVTPPVIRRLFRYYDAAADTGASVIFNTCSSIGDVAEYAKTFNRTPIVKIDDAMAEEAVQRGDTIGVIATLPTTLLPTISLLERTAAKKSRSIRIVQGLAEGAFDALISGNSDLHDQRIRETATRIAHSVDLFVLAQGSMARMEGVLSKLTGKPVLSSLRSGVIAVRNFLKNEGLL